MAHIIRSSTEAIVGSTNSHFHKLRWLIRTLERDCKLTNSVAKDRRHPEAVRTELLNVVDRQDRIIEALWKIYKRLRKDYHSGGALWRRDLRSLDDMFRLERKRLMAYLRPYQLADSDSLGAAAIFACKDYILGTNIVTTRSAMVIGIAKVIRSPDERPDIVFVSDVSSTLTARIIVDLLLVFPKKIRYNKFPELKGIF